MSGFDNLPRREFLEVAGLGVAGLATGCTGGSDEGGGDGGDGGGDGAGADGGDGGAADGGDGGGDGAGDGGDGGGEVCEPTRTDIEGPYYRDDIPERDDIATRDESGEVLVLHGRVVDGHCKPIPGARVDFWQADVSGGYDLETDEVHYYGYQVAGTEGGFTLNTLVPGRYLNGGTYRPAHIHVKVFVDGQELLTTQLYFEGDPYNEADPWWSEETTLTLDDDEGGTGKVAWFEFVVEPDS